MRPKLILLISIDTLRPDHLGCYGYHRDTSPTIDLLAKESAIFRNAFTTCSYTLPAHASLFTGYYPSNHSIGFNQGSGKLNPDVDITLAEMLRSQGYRTGAFVSSMVLRKETRLDLGFDYYDDEMTSAEANRPTELLRPCTETNKRVIDWLTRNKKDEVYVFLHYFDVHGPYRNPPDYQGLFVGDRWYGEERPLNVVPAGEVGGIPAYQVLNAVRGKNGELVKYEQDLRYYVAEYDAGIRRCDDAIREVLTELRRLGLYDDAFIVITSDHGEAFGENNVYCFHGLTLTLDQIQVPFLIKLPDRANLTQRVVDVPVSLVDIFPTILEIMGIQVSMDLQGCSLSRYLTPLAEITSVSQERETPLVAEIEGQIAYIDREWITLQPRDLKVNFRYYYHADQLVRVQQRIKLKFIERSGNEVLDFPSETWSRKQQLLERDGKIKLLESECHGLAQRTQDIETQNRQLQTQNRQLQERNRQLQAFADKVKITLPYRIYRKFIKPFE